MIRPGIERNGVSLPPEWMDDLIEVVVDREVNVPGRADLRLFDADLEHFGQMKIGDDISVSATDADGASTVVFTGEVVVIEVEEVTPGAERELLITAFDRSHRLGHVQDVKPMLKTSVADLLDNVIRSAGISPGSISVPGSTLPYHPARGTGLQILEALCAQFGVEWWVDARGKLSVGEQPTPPAGTKAVVDYRYRNELVQLSVRVAGFAPGQVSVPLWDPAKQEGSLQPSKVEQPTDGLSRKVGRPAWRKPYVLADDERARDAAEASSRASGFERRRLEETVVASGRVGWCDHRLELGTKLEIQQSGDIVGPYTVTSVRHVLSNSDSRTEFSTGRVRPSGLAALAGTETDAAPPPLAVGTVTKVLPKSEEGPDLGPVAVVQYSQLDRSYETGEARLLSIGGSSKHGLFVAPSVGDEVLVGYERGDLRYPVVLGGLHSEKHPVGQISDRNGKAVNTMRLRDGDKKGNELRFMLDRDEGTVSLTRANSNEVDAIVMDKDRVKVTAKEELVLEVGQSSITLKKDGTIEIKGKDISVTGTGNIKSKSQQNTEVEAMKATVKATSGLELDGGPKSELKSSGMTSVKGSMVQIN